MLWPCSVATKREVEELAICGHPPETIETITEVLGICPPCGRYVRRCDTRGRDEQGRLGHLECVDPKALAAITSQVERQQQASVRGTQ
jgi:hypothetical protein